MPLTEVSMGSAAQPGAEPDGPWAHGL